MNYRVGMIGTAARHWGYLLGPVQSMENASLVAVSNTDDGGLASLRKNKAFTDETKVYSDHREMLEKESLDIVGVWDTNVRHPDCIAASARAGVHIFTEKPVAVSLAGLERAKKAVEKGKVHLTMALNMRTEGKYRKVRELIRSGVIGEVTQCSCQKSYKVGNRPLWEQKRESLGGTIPYIACHGLDLLRWCSGLEFVKGAAFHNNLGNPGMGEMENTAGLICLADNGATVITRLDYCRPNTAPSWGDDRIRFAGTKGVVEIIDGKITLITREKKPHIVEPLKNPVSLFGSLIDVIEGRGKSILPAEDCFRITEIVLKLRNAADTQSMTAL